MTSQIQADVNVTPHQDVLKETIDVKLPSESMNTFSDKFRTDMVLSQSAKSTVKVTDSATGDPTTERYTIASVNPTDFYLTKIVRETDLRFKVTGLKTKQDHTQMINAVKGNTEGTYTFTVKPADGGDADKKTIVQSHVSGEIAGNPNPFTCPVWGVATDACNACVSKSSVNMGENSYSVDYSAKTEVIYDIEARRINKKVVFDEYNGILIPDKLMTKQYVVPVDKVNHEWTGPEVTTANAKITLTRSAVMTESLLAKYSEVDQDKNNSLNSNSRGKLMRKPNKTNPKYIFRKGIASPKRTFNTATRQWDMSADAANNVLYTFKAYNEEWPSDLADCQNLFDNGTLTFYEIAWFTDMVRPVYTATKTSDAEAPLALTYDFISEPKGQTLEIEILLEKVRSPVYNPILKYEGVSSWARTGKFSLELSLEARRKLWESIFDFSNSPSLKVEHDMNNSSIYLYQSTNKQLSALVQNKITIPFRHPNNMQQIPKEVLDIENPGVVEYNISQKYTHLPNDVLIFTDRAGSQIESIEITLGNGANVMTGTVMSDLLVASREKFDTFTEKDMTGYSVRWNKSNNKVGSWGRGDVLLLRMGEDIPLNDEYLLPNVSGINVNIDFKVRVKPHSLGETGNKAVTLHFINYYNSFYTIENSACGITSNLYKQSDIIKAYSKIEEQIKSNELYVNTSSFFGGGLSQILSKLKHVIPRIYKSAKIAKEIHDDMREPTKEMKRHVQEYNRNHVRPNMHRIRDLVDDFN